MKKINLLFVFLVLISGVFAQNIQIALVEYNADSQSGTLSISNTGNSDLRSVMLKIDSRKEKEIVEILSPGSSVYESVGVSPGEHTIVVSSGDIMESRNLLFSQSKIGVIEKKEEEKEVKKEASKRQKELERIASLNRQESEFELGQEREKAIALGVIEDDKINLILILSIIGIVVLIGILFWLIKKNKNE